MISGAAVVEHKVQRSSCVRGSGGVKRVEGGGEGGRRREREREREGKGMEEDGEGKGERGDKERKEAAHVVLKSSGS